MTKHTLACTDGTNSGPPLFNPLAGEFDVTVTVDSAEIPFFVYLRSFDSPAAGTATECGDSAAFQITGAGPFNIGGWSHNVGCVP